MFVLDDPPEAVGGAEEVPEELPSVEAIRAALHGSGRGWLRRIEVGVEGGCVVLRGQVPSYYLKQMALAAALAVPGVGSVRNELQVAEGRP